VPRAFKRPAKNLVVVVVVAATPNYLRQASPDRGKYLITHTFIYKLQRTHTHTRLPYFYKSSCMPRAVSFQRVDTVWTCVCVFLYLRTAHEAHVPLAPPRIYPARESTLCACVLERSSFPQLRKDPKTVQTYRGYAAGACVPTGQPRAAAAGLNSHTCILPSSAVAAQ
jgi:hypothetical protein